MKRFWAVLLISVFLTPTLRAEEPAVDPANVPPVGAATDPVTSDPTQENLGFDVAQTKKKKKKNAKKNKKNKKAKKAKKPKKAKKAKKKRAADPW